jgi:E3 ubiquitin-protein ligase HERC1
MVVMQVKLTDMQVRGTPRDMLSGDPHCAPLPAVLAEAYISLLRKLSISDTWSRQVNDYVLSCFFYIYSFVKQVGPGSIPGTTRKKSSGSGTGSTQPREYN